MAARILIVEDEPLIAIDLEATLQRSASRFVGAPRTPEKLSSSRLLAGPIWY